jgi:type II secretion system (T2SS) protein M
MKLARLSGRERRTLRIGTAAIVSLIAFSRGFPAWSTWRRDTAIAAGELTAEARRAESSVGRAAALGDTLAARQRRFLALAPAVLSGDSPALAAGTLADLVSGAAANAGVRLGSIQPRGDTASRGMFTPVAIRASGVGDVRGVMRLLVTLEAGPTLLSVRELAITQPEPAAGADRAEQLRIDLLIEALALNHKLRRTAQ